MRVKSYYGNTIREALDSARRELGPDASILASRHLDGGTHAYEVVCGMHDETAAGPTSDRRESTRPVATDPVAPPRAAATGPLSKLRAALSRATPEVAPFRMSLLADGFTEDLTVEIVAGVSQRQRQSGRKPAQQISCEHALSAELASRVRVAPTLGRDGSKRRIVALIGPPGAGKTTTLAKLAVRYGLHAQGPLHLVSADAYRVGGTDMLRAYAHGMAADFDAAPSAAALSQLIESHTARGLMLIDTPGLSAAEMQGASLLASLLSRHMDVDVHLVLPASLSPSAMAQVFDRFRAFLPSKIVVTGGDELPSCRAAIAQSLLRDMAFSFIGTGQLVPEDLMEATSARLCGHRTSGEAEAISAA